jgi:L-malate glycosyltransferase
MRVLFVNHTGRVSGGERSLLTLLEGLPVEIEPTVACPEGELSTHLRELDVAVRPIRGTDGSLRLHPTRTPLALGEIARSALQVRRIARDIDVDLVHANSIRAGLVLAATPLRAATVAHIRDCLPPGRASAASLRALQRIDALIANSEYTRRSLGPIGKRTEVIYNAVDVSRFDSEALPREEARRRLGLERNDEPVLAVIAQITPWKGQDDAIATIAELAPSHPGLRLLIVGSPKFVTAATRYDNAAYEKSLRRQVASAGLEAHVHFLGERSDIPQVLRAVDLLLVPSWEEPFGRSIIEAMAGGVPAIATEIGGPPEVIGSREPTAGVTLPPRQPHAWAQEIDSLISDPVRLRKMGEAARARARDRFALERHVGEILDLYQSLTSARNRR